MRSSMMLYGAVASLILGAGALTADALVTTDEERLEQLVDDLVERPASERVGAILAWTDLSRAPLEITTDGRRERYEESDDAELADDLVVALEGFTGSGAEVVQSSVNVDSDRATVAVRVRDGSATRDATFRLTRSGQGWVIVRLQAR